MGKIKLFITGMGGMTGRALVNYARTDNYLVGGTIYRNFPTDLKNLTDKSLLKCYLIDLRNEAETKKALSNFQPDVVVHLAGKALGRSDSQIFNPQIYTENISIFKNVLSAVKNLTNSPRFILSSGCLVYDKSISTDLITEIPIQDLPEVDQKKQPYRASRLDQEKLLSKEKGVDYIITRPTQITGPGKIPAVLEWYIANEILKIKAGESKKIKVRNKLGELDLLDVRDVARAYLLLIKQGVRGEIYHISSGSPTTVEHVSKIFLEVAHLNPSQFPVESTEVEQIIYFRFSPDKLNKLGWYPQFTLKDALTSYWEYFKNE